MHMLFRTIYIYLTRHFLKKADLGSTTEYTMRVLPIDLDTFMHVNNGVYLSFMDFGRWDMVFKNGLYDFCNKMGWYPVVASEAIRFKKSLKLWDKFTMKTKTVGYDDKYVYILQKFFCKGELMATGLVKVRFLKRAGGKVSPEEIVKGMGATLSNDAGTLSAEMAAFETKYDSLTL